MDAFDTPSKIDLKYAEDKIVFVICDCSLDKKYSFYYGYDRTLAKKLIDRLKHIQEHTWKQFSALGRKDGLTVEKPGESFEMIHNQNSCPNNMLEQYYFHFRVEKEDLFRVFGYQYKHYFCITHLDYKGKIQHS